MISQKKRTQLYKAVSDPIMNARIEVARLHCGMDKKIDGVAVEKILYKLYMDAPERALAIFETHDKK